MRVRLSNPVGNDIKNEKIDAKEDIEDVVTRECLLNVATFSRSLPVESLPTWNWIPVVFREARAQASGKRESLKKKKREGRERKTDKKNLEKLTSPRLKDEAGKIEEEDLADPSPRR